MGSKALIIAILGLLAAVLPDRGFAAGPTKYAILTKGKSCSFDIAEVSVKSFRLLAPMEQIDKLANKGLVNVHVCECYLMPGTVHRAGVRREGSIPVPLPPPACPRPANLRMNSRANKPIISSDFSFELRTPDRQSGPIVLRKARFSPELWTPSIRYGFRNSNV
jgi:hypothetical protein